MGATPQKKSGTFSIVAPLLQLSLLILIAPILASAAPAILATATTETTSSGSGSAPYLSSPSFLLFALISLLVGLFLLLYGHRGWRVTTALGCGLLIQFLVWVIIANTLPSNGFSDQSKDKTGIIVWALVSAGGLAGLVIGAWWWRIGVFALGACAGLALGLQVASMGDGGLPVVARWVVIAVLALVGLIALPFTANTMGMVIATCLTGSFLFFLGIDLFVNKVDGMSLGLRYILDGNSGHAAELASYYPPTSTRVLLGLSWAVSLLAMAFQGYFYVHRQRRPFIRQVLELKAVDIAPETPTPSSDIPDFASDYRLPHLPTGLSDDISVRSGTSARVQNEHEMQQRYRLAVDNTDPSPPLTPEHRGSSPLLPVDTLRKIEALRHSRDLSSPDDPPSRPASVLSSSYGAQLRSRPPTFFDFDSSPLPALQAADRSPASPLDDSLFRPSAPVPPTPTSAARPTSSCVSQAFPIVPVPPSTLDSQSAPYRTSIPTSLPVGPDSEDGAATLQPDSSSPASVSTAQLTVGGQVAAAFRGGLERGQAASLPATATATATARTPSSGDISTLLGGKFESPVLACTSTPPVLFQSSSAATPSETPEEALVDEEGRPSQDDSEARSFATAGDESFEGFPTTPTGAYEDIRTEWPLGRSGAGWGTRGAEEGREELR